MGNNVHRIEEKQKVEDLEKDKKRFQVEYKEQVNLLLEKFNKTKKKRLAQSLKNVEDYCGGNVNHLPMEAEIIMFENKRVWKIIYNVPRYYGLGHGVMLLYVDFNTGKVIKLITCK